LKFPQEQNIAPIKMRDVTLGNDSSSVRVFIKLMIL
jgi:hypothetical protein